jgi:hypothetical protein
MGDYNALIACDKCKSPNIEESHFSELHGHRYVCKDCRYTCWGGKIKNKDRIEKRPPCPSPADLNINWCQMCLLDKSDLGYAETLETNHIDDNPQNCDRLNLLVVCSSCHKLIHHQRTYRYNHYVRRQNRESKS